MKPNLVLDLDLTLGYTHPDKGDLSSNEKGEDPKLKFKNLKLYTDSRSRKLRNRVYKVSMINSCGECVGQEDEMYGVYRPYLTEFIEFLNEECDNIIIWTAGMRSYGYEMTENIFAKSKKKPILIYTRVNRGSEHESKLKPLKDLFRDPVCIERGINETNTLIIDDNDETFVKNRRNAIHITEFSCDLNKKEILENDDVSLLKIIKWFRLKEVRDSTDLRKLDKSKIFSYSLEEYDEMLKKEK